MQPVNDSKSGSPSSRCWRELPSNLNWCHLPVSFSYRYQITVVGVCIMARFRPWAGCLCRLTVSLDYFQILDAFDYILIEIFTDLCRYLSTIQFSRMSTIFRNSSSDRHILLTSKYFSNCMYNPWNLTSNYPNVLLFTSAKRTFVPQRFIIYVGFFLFAYFSVAEASFNRLHDNVHIELLTNHFSLQFA